MEQNRSLSDRIRSLSFWLIAIPVVVGVLTLGMTFHVSYLSDAARAQAAALEVQTELARAQLQDLTTERTEEEAKLKDLETALATRQTKAERLEGQLAETQTALGEARSDLGDALSDAAEITERARCEFLRQTFADTAWIGTYLALEGEDRFAGPQVAGYTKRDHRELYDELGGDAFDTRMRRNYANRWSDIAGPDTVPYVGVGAQTVNSLLEVYFATVLGSGAFQDLLGEAAPRPAWFTVNDMMDVIRDRLKTGGVIGEAALDVLDDYAGEPTPQQADNLWFTIDPSRVDLSFAEASSLSINSVTLSEAEIRLLDAEVERFDNAHFHAMLYMQSAASGMLSGCSIYLDNR